MHTKASLIQDLTQMGIDSKGTLLVHSSYKSIGEVEGEADTVLDALSEYMKEGLLVLPTHTWARINAKQPKYSIQDTPTNVGILTELFRHRPGVVRSGHPTHSVAALGEDAAEFVAGDERHNTPCARESVYGKLLDRGAQILMIGVDLRKNTYIHGIEEWNDIPGRLSADPEQLYTVLPDGTEIFVPSYRHHGPDWSMHFWKVDHVLEERGAMKKFTFGDAESRVCDAARTMEVISELLQDDPDLFSDNEPMKQEIQES